jgi:flagellar biosynthesis protein FlhG
MTKPIRELVQEAVGEGKTQAFQSPVHLIKAIEEIDRDKAKSLSKRIRALQLKMVLNYVSNYEDIEMGFSIRSACKKYFGIEFDYIGYVNKDDHMMESVRLRTPILSEFPNSNSARCIENITNKLLTKEQLSFDFL